MNTIETESLYTSGLYSKHPINIVKGRAATLWDENGNVYIDCMAGHGVANIGHAHPKLVSALNEQAQKLITLPETYYNDSRSKLMAKLCNMVPGLSRVFFCNSGTETIEAAIKFSRLSSGKTGILAFMRGFHGRTLGALSATWNKTYRQPFEPLVPDIHHVPYNNLQALENAINNNLGAIILEVIQGEGGVNLANPIFLEKVQEITRERGILLIIDEVQTGYGRTGKFFAFQHFNLQPDMVCFAKSMAGGIPMGAVLIGERIQNLAPGMHGSTFGGNPLACAAANCTLEIIDEEDLLNQATQKGDYFFKKLQRIQNAQIREIRGRGLMIGIELKQKVAPYLQEMMKQGVLALPAGLTVIRLLPPLVITYEQIDRVVEILEKVLETVNVLSHE